MSQTILNPDGNIIGYYGEGGKCRIFWGIGGMKAWLDFLCILSSMETHAPSLEAGDYYPDDAGH